MMNSHVQTLDALRRRLRHLRNDHHYTWREIAAMDEFGGASAGLLSSILKGYEPKTNLSRAKLNLPPLAVPIELCPDCGIVHTYSCRDEKVIGLGGESPYPPYFKCRRDDIDQVARQLEKYFPGRFRRVK